MTDRVLVVMATGRRKKKNVLSLVKFCRSLLATSDEDSTGIRQEPATIDQVQSPSIQMTTLQQPAPVTAGLASSETSFTADDWFVAVTDNNLCAVNYFMSRGADLNTRCPAGNNSTSELSHAVQSRVIIHQRSRLTVFVLRPVVSPDCLVVVHTPLSVLSSRVTTNETRCWYIRRLCNIHSPSLAKDKTPDQNLNVSGWSALHISAWNGQLDLMRLLLESGTCHVDQPGPGAVTPLILAAQRTHPDIVQLLVAAGCDVTRRATLRMRGARGHVAGDVTALHVAAQAGDADVVRQLVAAGAAVNATMKAGQLAALTPLHLAVEAGHSDVIDVLIMAGSDVNGRTSLCTMTSRTGSYYPAYSRSSAV